MTMPDSSAMTEASGLSDGNARIAHASDAIQDMTDDMNDRPIPLATDSRTPAQRLSERLRQMTVEAPLQSLAIAFLLGVLVARRRR